MLIKNENRIYATPAVKELIVIHVCVLENQRVIKE